MAQIDPIIITSTHLKSPKRGKRPALPPLHKGELVEGRVLRAVSTSRAIILIKGRQLVARTPLPLNTDSLPLFKVEQVAPECLLKLLQVSQGQPQGFASFIRRAEFQRNAYQYLIDLIGPLTGASHDLSKQRLPELIRQMLSLTRRISLAPARTPDRLFLESIIERSGVLWENKLRSLFFSGIKGKKEIQALVRQDLKGLALTALEDEGAMRFVSSEGLTKFIDSLEQFQLANLVGLEEKGRVLLVIPMQWDGIFRLAQVLVGFPGKDEEKRGQDEKALTLSLFLDMFHLGPIRIDASVHDRVIRICFLVCSDDVQALLNRFANHLKSQVERHGFSVRQITCRVEDQQVLEKTSFVDSLVDFGEHRVSVVV